MSLKRNVPGIKALKGKERVVCVTAYDLTGGMIADQAGVDVVLVGDSVGNVVLGYPATVPVTLDEMVHHVKATRRGVSQALLVADLPFGSYGASVEQAVESAFALMKAGAEAVKLEGDYPEEIRAMIKAGIPVMGHVGFTPQSVNKFGGFRVQGRTESDPIVAAAKSIDEAGCFAIVLELIPAPLASKITQTVGCPTIGIGAGMDCDGEIQVFHDIMGLSPKLHKHTKKFGDAGRVMRRGMKQYVQAVKDRTFPTSENSF